VKHIHYLDQEAEKTETDGAKGAVIRHIITEKDGAPNFNLRVVTIEPGGQSPNHSHPWEHEFFVPPDTQHCLRAAETMEVI
jgi:quercetin dioxygenase-like cupin family protein